MNRNAFGLAFGATLAIALVCGVAAAQNPEQAPEQPVPPATVTDEPTVPLELPEPSADATEPPVALPEQGDINTSDVVSQPVTETEPVTEPDPWADPEVKPVSTSPSLDYAKVDWDLDTLECGINAKPEVSQDAYGNWWAYCDPFPGGNRD